MVDYDYYPSNFSSFIHNLSWNELLTILFVGLLIYYKRPIHMDDERRMATRFYGSLFKFWGIVLQIEAISLS
jgi:hypothetical protein